MVISTCTSNSKTRQDTCCQRDRQTQKVETDDWKETPVLVGGGSENKQ